MHPALHESIRIEAGYDIIATVSDDHASATFIAQDLRTGRRELLYYQKWQREEGLSDDFVRTVSLLPAVRHPCIIQSVRVLDAMMIPTRFRRPLLIGGLVFLAFESPSGVALSFREYSSPCQKKVPPPPVAR